MMPETKEPLPEIERRAAALLLDRLSKEDRQLYRALIDGTLLEAGHSGHYKALNRKLRAETPAAIAQLRRWEQEEIRFVSYGETLYPRRLAEIYDPPLLLFYQGTLTDLVNTRGTAAIVGARRADPAACRTAEHFAGVLAEAGNCIVSGLALGVDGAAHRGALESCGSLPTIAVLGSGLHNVYPQRHRGLARRILDAGGLLISQFEPAEEPRPYNFLNRNRIIAGLSDGVAVIQAGRRSGSLATARHALDAGREVLAVPGAIDDSRYAGSNRLIQQGAGLITSAEDIIQLLPELTPPTAAALSVSQSAAAAAGANGRNSAQNRIISLLEQAGQLDAAALLSQPGAQNWLIELLELELDGVIERLPGGLFALSLKTASRSSS